MITVWTIVFCICV